MPLMKAVQIHRFGAEDVMQLDDVEIPSPEARQMVIKIAATSINHSDLFIRKNGNIHIGPRDLPLILGRELAGTVVECGPNVSEFAPGQRVVALPAVQTRAIGLPGSKEYTGCYAEYSLARPQDTRLLPDGIDWVAGAATPWAALTAWYVLAAAAVKAGDRVFIQAGGSGVGTFAVQFAKILGARVFATAGSDEKCSRVAELGADVAINYHQKDFAAELLRLTEGRGVDAAVETVGGEALAKSLRVLAPGGRLIALGSLSGGSRDLPTALAEGRKASRFSITAFLMEEPQAIAQLDQIFAWVKSGQVRAVVDRTFPLAQAAAAHRHIANRQNFGKVVLAV
jgi:NADPH:quinone reductase-like Zn-dependent oxidoreductase